MGCLQTVILICTWLLAAWPLTAHVQVEKELSDICSSILKLLDDHLIPTASSGESKVFYLKMKGDYHRYLAEFKTGADRKDAAEHTLLAYKAAQARWGRVAPAFEDFGGAAQAALGSAASPGPKIAFHCVAHVCTGLDLAPACSIPAPSGLFLHLWSCICCGLMQHKRTAARRIACCALRRPGQSPMQAGSGPSGILIGEATGGGPQPWMDYCSNP